MKKITYIATAAAAALMLTGCQFKEGPDYSTYYANAVVTVKHTGDGVMYFQLDEHTTVKPSNLGKSPFGEKEVRAICNLELSDEKPESSSSEMTFDKSAHVNWIDSVRTKDIVASQGSTAADELKYGNDPIEIIDNFVTVLEDGYLTLSFCALWGNPSIAHAVNLVTGVDPDDPYTLEFRHDAFDDPYYLNPIRCTGIVAFNLDELPDTGAETVDLKIRYKSIAGGERTVKFKYCSAGPLLYTVNPDADVKSLVSSASIK